MTKGNDLKLRRPILDPHSHKKNFFATCRPIQWQHLSHALPVTTPQITKNINNIYDVSRHRCPYPSRKSPSSQRILRQPWLSTLPLIGTGIFRCRWLDVRIFDISSLYHVSPIYVNNGYNGNWHQNLHEPVSGRFHRRWDPSG